MNDERGRRLTRKQKIIISSQPRKLNADNWLCLADDGKKLTIRHKISGRIAYINYG